jgi:hypothetical protein
MKRSYVIILLFLISLISAETTELNEQINGLRRPLYEKIPLIRDYRINQPIKGAIRWGTVGLITSFGSAYIIQTQRYADNEYYYNRNNAFMIAWKTSKISILAGTVFGLYKGIKAQNYKKKDLPYIIKMDKFGYEASLMVDPFITRDAVTNKIFQSIVLTYDHKFYFVDELQFGIVWVRWPETQTSYRVYSEIKYDLRGVHYYRKDHIFSPYYGLGGGLSFAKYEIGEWYFDETKTTTLGVYPFLHSSAGLKFSFLDFFYLKIETDIELSTFYFIAKSYENYPLKTNLVLGLVIGTKIF